ncbi:hypothetical protein ACFFWD_14470 [Bradyrhizobium erythrophlei]|uniref:hypothetical protein n=1 Tax=Bradyrhizobium erythrophlei TaxID=1437360 RepID=UPI0035EED170
MKAALLAAIALIAGMADASAQATLHYASGLGASEARAGAELGFNMADVGDVESLNALPQNMKGLIWLGIKGGATAEFQNKVKPFIGNPRVFGFYLWDEPDPTGKYGELITPNSLKEQSDWIHRNVPGAKTFIVLMSMGSSSAHPDYMNTYNPANTGIDLYGLDPYPFRTDTAASDLHEIDAAVAAAVQAGIPASKIVPIFQAFGGGTFNTPEGGKFVVPAPTQLRALIDRWSSIIPSPEFDYAYSWGNQQGDTALRDRPELQAVFKAYNAGRAALAPSRGR